MRKIIMLAALLTSAASVWADGIRMLKEAGADEAVLKIKSLEAFEKVADGQATTILLPAELQGIASLATAWKETGK